MVRLVRLVGIGLLHAHMVVVENTLRSHVVVGSLLISIVESRVGYAGMLLQQWLPHLGTSYGWRLPKISSRLGASVPLLALDAIALLLLLRLLLPEEWWLGQVLKWVHMNE